MAHAPDELSVQVDGIRGKRALLERHLQGLRAFVRSRIGRAVRSRESSLDLAQSVCREVLEDLRGFDYRGEGSFRRWLEQRAEHKICDRARYWTRERRTASREVRIETLEGVPRGLESLGTPSRHVSSKEELDRVERAFLCLPPEQREVIALARLAGLPHEEVARRMQRTPSATRSLLSRALARLSTRLETEELAG